MSVQQLSLHDLKLLMHDSRARYEKLLDNGKDTAARIEFDLWSELRDEYESRIEDLRTIARSKD